MRLVRAVCAEAVRLDHGEVRGKARRLGQLLYPRTQGGLRDHGDPMTGLAYQTGVGFAVASDVRAKTLNTLDAALVDQTCERAVDLIGHDLRHLEMRSSQAP